MSVVICSVVIHASSEKVFDFHTDTRNLRLISPSWMKTDIHTTTGEGRGKIIELDMTHFGIIRNKWLVEISEYDRPRRITDTALKGPFKQFCHERDVRYITDTSCELTDTLDYELPCGVVGKIVDALMMKSFIKKMFRDRHIKTKQILERQ